jgi:2-oxoisovalerate dehydrogenase E2 component (dihydrolipoyl transacylase)
VASSSAAAASTIAAAVATQAQSAAAGGKVLSTPAVRHIARNNNVDLALVPATGPHGRILKGDVLAYLAVAATAAAASPAPATISTATAATAGAVAAAAAAGRSGGGIIPADRTEPVRGIKRLMVQSMKQSLKIPHFVYADEFEMGAASALRRQINEALAGGSAASSSPAQNPPKKISYLPLILKAASLALADYPILNSSLSADESEIVYVGFSFCCVCFFFFFFFA